MRSVPLGREPGIDSSCRSDHPLPWRNAPSRGENHVRDANDRSVYSGTDAAEMFRLYDNAVQFETQIVARRDAEHVRRRGRRRVPMWPAGVAMRVRGMLHRR